MIAFLRRLATRRATRERTELRPALVLHVTVVAHEKAGAFLGCSGDEVAFGQSMTSLNFLLTRALARELKAGDEVLVTRLDHDGNVAPWLALQDDLAPEIIQAAAQIVTAGRRVGGGVGLVACCDMALAVKGACFCLSEVKLGLIPAVISPYVIAAIGERASRRYFQSAEVFDALEACLGGSAKTLEEGELGEEHGKVGGEFRHDRSPDVQM